MSSRYKYPRTWHLPHSEGATSDDRTLTDVSCFDGKQVIITEKMDGEASTLYNDHIHARSLDSKDHPSRHWLKGLWGQIRNDIPEDWRICGENMYAKHSIAYSSLESYFYVYSIWDENNFCLSWDETKEYSSIFGLVTVPEIYSGAFDERMIKELPGKLDPTTQEGFVVRNSDRFHYDDFATNVAKWVRKNHVVTESHWMFDKVIPNGLKR